PFTVQWWISQDDQPYGIARKSFPATFSIPSMSTDSTMAIGNSNQGIFMTARDGTTTRYLVRQSISDHPLPATLERVLWQPAHAIPHFLFAITSSSQKSGSFTTFPTKLIVQLMLGNMQGQMTSLAACTCTQFTWSPDGNSILYSTGTTYTVLNLNTHASFSSSGENGSVPYWSPDSQLLLLNGIHTLSLISVVSGRQNIVLSDGYKQGSGETASPQSDVHALLQPALNSPWSADSRHFLFLTKNRLQWQGKSLSTGNGLYTVSLDGHGQTQGTPSVVDLGNDSQAGWTYEDPNTSFLF
ncbi:MAG: hypothetical protein M3Z24_17175, partial [Chloroflexota bacterium]|nr:hypothetical protein [Chloroflexota bacterium]